MGSTGRAAAAELVAAFTLVFVAAGAAIAAGLGLDPVGVALAYGAIVAVAATITAGVSVGLSNPAIVLGLWVIGRLSALRASALVLAQLLGALAASFLLRWVAPGTAFETASGGTPTLAAGIATGKGIVIEATITFVFAVAALVAAVDARGTSRTAAALALGLVVVSASLAFGPYTGAAMNPVRWFGPAVASGTWEGWFVWVVGPLAGGVIAAVLCSVSFLREFLRETPPP